MHTNKRGLKMAWIHVDRADVNNVDIFAFVNLKQSVIIKGRVTISPDLKTSVLVMDSAGGIRGTVELPEWAFFSTEDALAKAFYEEVDALPGADYKNKVWNMKHSNYKPEQLSKLIERVTSIAFDKPEAVILKYVPDLSIDDSMFEQFEF